MKGGSRKTGYKREREAVREGREYREIKGKGNQREEEVRTEEGNKGEEKEVRDA